MDADMGVDPSRSSGSRSYSGADEQASRGDAMDAIDRVVQEFYSEQFMKEHARHLVEEAATRTGQDPKADLAGLILAPGAKEVTVPAGALADAWEKGSGEPFRRLAPREAVLQMLQLNAPHLKDWLEAQGAWEMLQQPSTGAHRKLLVVCATRDGHRAAVFPYEPKKT